MDIEIVAIGNELLSGYTINSNAAFISLALLNAGLRVVRQTALPDDRRLLLNGLQEALQRSELVICTGGLGPTLDDLTREIAAQLFQSGFHYDEEIAADLEKRYGSALQSLKDQATVPDKAIVMKNEAGTAPGFIFHSDKNTLILLPGVPPEMRAMFMKYALPYIQQNFEKIKRHYGKQLHLYNLPESTVDVVLRQLQLDNIDIEFGIYVSQGIVDVHLSTLADSESEAAQHLASAVNFLSGTFKEHLFASSSGKIEQAVHDRMIERHATLSIAESCTGGSIAARLTSLPGSSQYFLGSIVAYSNRLKNQLLGVPENVLKDKGAVSKEAVLSMLTGIFERTGSDYAIAITGIAGPTGGTVEKPVGTVWLAVGRKDKTPIVWQFHAYGNREMVIERSVNAALAKLLEVLEGRNGL